MASYEEAGAAFNKIIKHGPGTSFRKAAEVYWIACQSDAGAGEEEGKQLEAAISKIPIDYRTPALKCLEDFNACRENGTDIKDCYFSLAVNLANKIVHVI